MGPGKCDHEGASQMAMRVHRRRGYVGAQVAPSEETRAMVMRVHRKRGYVGAQVAPNEETRAFFERLGPRHNIRSE